MEFSRNIIFINPYTKWIIIIFFMLISINLKSTAADVNDGNIVPTDTTIYTKTNILDTNSYSSNFNKYINLITFNNNINVMFENNWGEFSLTNVYSGSYLNINEINIQDDELYTFEYQKEILKNLNLQFQQNYLLSSNSRNIGINQLSRLNGLLGLNYYFWSNSQAQIMAGVEENSILGINSTGTLYKTKININKIKFSTIQANLDFSGDWLLLNLNRLEKEINGKLDILGDFADVANISLFTNYRNLQNNLLYPNIMSNSIPYEIRNQSNFFNDLSLKYEITQHNSISLNFQIISDNIKRQYYQPVASIDYSYLTRNIEQFELSSQISIFSNYKYISNLFSMGFVNRNENNILTQSNNEFSGDLTKLKNFENQKDFQYTKVSLYNSANILLSKNTNIQANYSVNLIQYDTPSKLNYDDRDEFRSFLQANINHRFSKYLQLSLTFENINNHLVFLFAERSGLNNWNRIYRFSPKIQYRNKFLELNPQFEVLSNYTIYDFDNTSSYTKSISLRNIGYADSILINVNDKTLLKNQVKYQISERGILFWHEFSEIPQISIHQFFIKSLLIRKYNNCNIGIGINLFDYQQDRISEEIVDHKIYSISPEIELDYHYKDWRVEMDGWYEFQTVNYSNKLEIPNLLIKVYINL